MERRSSLVLRHYFRNKTSLAALLKLFFNASNVYLTFQYEHGFKKKIGSC